MLKRENRYTRRQASFFCTSLLSRQTTRTLCFRAPLRNSFWQRPCASVDEYISIHFLVFIYCCCDTLEKWDRILSRWHLSKRNSISFLYPELMMFSCKYFRSLCICRVRCSLGVTFSMCSSVVKHDFLQQRDFLLKKSESKFIFAVFSLIQFKLKAIKRSVIWHLFLMTSFEPGSKE